MDEITAHSRLWNSALIEIIRIDLNHKQVYTNGDNRGCQDDKNDSNFG